MKISTERTEIVGLGRRALLLAAIGSVLLGARIARAQETQGPRIPPPPDHNVKRVTTDAPTVEAPPETPQPLIIKQFAQKEEEYARARVRFGYKKTVKLTEYGPDGNPMGEFSVLMRRSSQTTSRSL